MRTRVHHGEAVTLTKGFAGHAARVSRPRVLLRGKFVTSLIWFALGDFYPRQGTAYHRRGAGPHDEGWPAAAHLAVRSSSHYCPHDQQGPGKVV